MNLTRRQFLKVSAGFTGFLVTSSAFDLIKVPKALADMGPKTGTETTSICCCCACGCGMLITTKDFGLSTEQVINVEGDPTHPTNNGGLCSKCLSAKDTVNQRVPDTGPNSLATKYALGKFINKWPDDKRLARVLYRAPQATKWEILDWPTALPMIADRIAQTRALDFTESDGMTVNRCTNIACLGGAAHDNQECYLLRKLMTGLGLVYIEHQARI